MKHLGYNIKVSRIGPSINGRPASYQIHVDGEWYGELHGHKSFDGATFYDLIGPNGFEPVTGIGPTGEPRRKLNAHIAQLARITDIGVAS